MKVIRPVNSLFRSALDYRTYRLERKSQSYEGNAARKIAKYQKRLEVQICAKKLDGSDPITLLAFLSSFQDACDINGISEGSAFWLIEYFFRDQGQAVLQSVLSGIGARKGSKSRKRSERLRNYCEVVNYLLMTYATDDHIAETDTNIRAYRQQNNQTELQ